MQLYEAKQKSVHIFLGFLLGILIIKKFSTNDLNVCDGIFVFEESMRR
jgi:hypothetical protein